MPAPLKSEAVVLRSIRYGEADRILHLYTPNSRPDSRDRQRRAPRAQPLRRPARAFLPRPPGPARGPGRAAHGHGRGHDRLPRSPARERAGAERRRPRLRRRLTAVRDRGPPPGGLSAAAHGALAAKRRPVRGRRERARVQAQAAAGGRVRAPARCLRLLRHARRAAELLGRRRRRGVRRPCASNGFPLDAAAYGFLVAALGNPLAQAPEAPAQVLRQVERAISETAEHHGHVRLRPLVGMA